MIGADIDRREVVGVGHEVGGAVEYEGGQLARPAQRQGGDGDQNLHLRPSAQVLRCECHAQLGDETGGIDLLAAPQEHGPSRQPRSAGPGRCPPVRWEPQVNPVARCGFRCDQSRDLGQPHGQHSSGQLDALVVSITIQPRFVGVMGAGEQCQQRVSHASRLKQIY